MRKSKVYIIGVAPEGAPSLSPATRRLVTRAEIVFGGGRLLEMFPSLAGEKLIIKNNLAEVAGLIKANLGLKRMVVLASGDPNFFGIAKYLTGKLGKEIIEIVPNVSAMQVAFARIKENWDDAALVSVHSRPIEDIVEIVRSNHKIGIFTDDRNTPKEIARVLQERDLDNCRVFICQDLGSEQERIVSTYLDRLNTMEFSPLSVMILIRDGGSRETPHQQLLGIPEEKFHQRQDRSLITKLEVRAISLAKLGLNEDSTVWDIGAGSGAIAIEASLLARKGRIFAIEKDDNCIANVRKNIEKFRRPNITVIQTLAPDELEELPAPTAVFIGGSRGKLAAILDCVCRRLRSGGRIVINVATFENLNGAISSLKANGFATETTLVNIARSKDISDLTRLEALNPVFIITGKRKKETDKNEQNEQ